MPYLIWSISQPLWLFSTCFAGFFWIFYNRVFTSASGGHQKLPQQSCCLWISVGLAGWALRCKSRPRFLYANPPEASHLICWKSSGLTKAHKGLHFLTSSYFPNFIFLTPFAYYTPMYANYFSIKVGEKKPNKTLGFSHFLLRVKLGQDCALICMWQQLGLEWRLPFSWDVCLQFSTVSTCPCCFTPKEVWVLIALYHSCRWSFFREIFKEITLVIKSGQVDGRSPHPTLGLSIMCLVPCRLLSFAVSAQSKVYEARRLSALFTAEFWEPGASRMINQCLLTEQAPGI